MENKAIFVDTNLFLRYLTNDVPQQAEAFEKILTRASSGQASLVINSLVIAEIVWTLESFYKVSKTNIQARILAILNTQGLQVVDEEIILQAIIWYADKNIDYIDAYNAAWMFQHGVESLYTFDRKHYARIEGLNILVPGEVDR
jgi:predicted nucleic-acid-binding protein